MIETKRQIVCYFQIGATAVIEDKKGEPEKKVEFDVNEQKKDPNEDPINISQMQPQKKRSPDRTEVKGGESEKTEKCEFDKSEKK